MPGQVDDYIARLERELHRRGQDDPRMLAEAREHLLDAVADGRQRGLSVDEAEQEALERFGAPAIVAAHLNEEKDQMNGFSGAAARIWQRKWWIVVPAIVSAIITGVLAQYMMPTRYRAHTEMILLARLVPSASAPMTVVSITSDIERRIWALLDRSHLEEIINELDLYAEKRNQTSLTAAVEQMRRDIRIESLGYRSGGAAHAIRVSFAASDAAIAKQVTERLAMVLIDQNLEHHTDRVGITTAVFESRIAEMREQIIEHERRLASLVTPNSRAPVSQADLIPYEVLKEQYKALIARQLDAQIAGKLEAREASQQFRIIDAARMPQVPDGPSHMRVTILGTLVGLLVGLVFVLLRRTPQPPPALAQA